MAEKGSNLGNPDAGISENGKKGNSSQVKIPEISLPKGGGAIRGIDEKFQVNSVTGTASFSIPLPFSPARGVTPSSGLSYNSGSGNGIFGLGWMLSFSSVKRKTGKGIPQYLDDNESDTFVFSEADDLVPEFEKNEDDTFKLDLKGEYKIIKKDSPDGLFDIRYYRPRIEGLFARIERWRSKASNEIKWKITTKENVSTLFGWSSDSRIEDPSAPGRIFEWLPEFVFDDKGNCAHYLYKKEDELGFDKSLLHNRNRFKNGRITYTNSYPEKIFYGNKTPYKKFGDNFPSPDDYLFSSVFDYGEYDQNAPFSKTSDWIFRQDAFSDYKAGFEIRTTRLCRRILFFHHFRGSNEYDGLVKSFNFEFDTNTEEDFTFLKSITHYGYIKKADGSYSFKAMPSAEFYYQPHEWNREVKTAIIEDNVDSQADLDPQKYQFTDLFNEGLPGILSENTGAWYYRDNLGNGRFGRARVIAPKPSFTGLGRQLLLVDLDADGGKQLARLSSGSGGFFELNDEHEWSGFQTFKSMPNIDLDDPGTRMLDLNGDGRADIVISEENVFTWYKSDGREGYSPATRISKPDDEESGPYVVFADSEQTIFLADMSGDGLTDIVRIRNGEVCYWPNLGYGRFGKKVSMDNSPLFDHPDAFNPAWIKLADIDGSGTTDIIYLGRKRFTCWNNLSGNRFSVTPFEIETFPEIHSQAYLNIIDLLGNGMSCIVWSSLLSKDTNTPLKYIDPMNSRKPHIMVSFKNNLGKEVTLEYASSTNFYIDDKLAGKPWVTKLHFPVHCISRTITEDKISGYRFVSEYRYHHGYYDHAEREFRGFGMVEQKDAETFEHWKKVSASNIVEESLHQEPVVTRTWFHTGAFRGMEKTMAQFKEDYWYAEFRRQGFPLVHYEVNLPDAKLIAAPPMLPQITDNLSVEEWQEASRACKSMKLRSEIFALDAVKYGNTEAARKKELTPYSVYANSYVIEMVQPKGKNKNAIFILKESESITYTYERNPEDPRVAHNLNVEFDKYGNVLESAAVVYPRIKTDLTLPPETQQEQNKTVIIYTKNSFTNDVISDKEYQLRMPSEVQSFDLRGKNKLSDYYKPIDFKNILDDVNSETVFYHEIEKPLTPGKAQKRLIEHTRTTYYRDDLTGSLPLHQLKTPVLQFENYQLAYTPELISDIFSTKVNSALLSEANFAHSEGDNNWWIPSGTARYLRGGETATEAGKRFYMPVSYTFPSGSVTKVKYYGTYFLFIEEIEDALGNRKTVDLFNFRTLSPQRMRDINDNLSEAITDELNMVKAVAIMGKGSEADELAGLTDYTEAAETALINEFFNAPDSVQLITRSKALLKHATTRFVYDLEAYVRNKKPSVASTIIREEHHVINADPAKQISFEYSNGIGEIVMKKVQAAPGLAKTVIVNPDNSITINEINTSSNIPGQLRWIGSGRTIKNNKGNPVKQYEPYFSVSHKYEDTKELVETGVTPLIYYDSAGRLIMTEMPNGTFSRTEFDSWKQIVYDVNDTVLESKWYKDRANRLIDLQLLAEGKDPGREKLSADKTSKHANTPNTVYLNTLGRAVLSVGHNKNMATNADEFYRTKVNLDTEGNLRSIIDARELPENNNKGNTVMQYKYDMLGNSVYQKSMDSGQRWLLFNVQGKLSRLWDERNHEFRYYYDALFRPTHNKVIGGEGSAILDNIYERTIYGESLLAPDRSNETELKSKNILGKPVKHYDTGGVLLTPEYNFKEKPEYTTRKLFKYYKSSVNWIDANLLTDLETEEFTILFETDALGRKTEQTAPDSSKIFYTFNETGLLKSETVTLFNPDQVKTMIKDIDYNEKGQRSKIIYGNDVLTRFYYDRETFFLNRLESKRQNNDPVQDLYYTFDPGANITFVHDKNVPVVFFDNQKIEGLTEYTYDALYRLVEARGRENNAALSFDEKDNWNDASFIKNLNQGDIMAMRNYTQSYRYDQVGNITQMRHQAGGNNWTRDYSYEKLSNRLKSTQVGTEIYSYSHHQKHGLIISMPHLQDIGWGFNDEMLKSIRQKVNPGNGTAETTWYQYDGSGKRIRKITENSAGPGISPTRKEERIYIDGYETYRTYKADKLNFERETLSLIDNEHRFVMIETVTFNSDPTPPPYEKTGVRLIRYQLDNHLGSASIELDDNAQIISYEEYHPFGTTSFQARNAAINATAKRYRFTGMERDEESGLEYHNSRYYSPWLGRWISSDPAGIEDGTNVFIYVNDNPVLMIDPGGQSGEETKLTKPAVIAALEQKGLPYATEVKFDLVDAAGKVITSGRFDVMTIDPRTGSLIIPELKGKNLEDITKNQKIYIPILESSQGGIIKVTGSKGGSMGVSAGVSVKINQDNYVRVGVKDLNDFSEALQTVAGGAPIKHSFLDKSGKMHLFTSSEAFKDFLETTGRGSLASKISSKLKGVGPVIALAGVVLWATSAQAAEVRSEPVSSEELEDLKSNLRLRLSVGNTLNETVNAAPFGDLATYLTIGVQVDAILKLKALEFATLNNLRDFKGRLQEIENAPYLIDPQTGALYEINMGITSKESLGTLTKVTTLDKSIFGWYSDAKNVVYREENQKLYLRQW
jgi:RHS repeat-associated protein